MARKRKRSFSDVFQSISGGLLELIKRPIVFAWLFTVCGLTVLTALSVPKLRAAHPAPSDIWVSFTQVPEWLDDSLVNELTDLARGHLANEPIARDGLIATSTALAQSGWFEEIRQVRWTSDNHAEIDAQFMIPYAKVNDGNRTYFIDMYGKLVPSRVGQTVKDNYHFIALEQLAHPAPPRPGMQWDGKDVIASLQLLHLFYDYEWGKQIKTINLSRFSGNKTIQFTTTTPSVFVWGSPPNEERALEALAIQKLERLSKAHESFGAIDQNDSGQFDLTDPHSFIRK